MMRLSILAAAVTAAACAPGGNGVSLTAGDATGGPVASAGNADGGSADLPGVAPPALPPGFDPTKTGVQSGVWPDGRPWIVVVDVPWWL